MLRRWTPALLALALTGCAEPPPPSFLLYVVDTLRADALGCYGGPATPNIDRLAGQATLYEQAYAASSWTRPSMASLFSGLSAAEHGVEQRSGRLAPELATLPGRLAAAGYRTAFITANPNAGAAFGFGHGFDELQELYRRRDPGWVGGGELVASSAEIVDRAIDWLEQAPEPFFLAVLDVGPHHPFTPPGAAPEALREMERVRATLESGRLDETVAQRVRELARELYGGEVQALDSAFGKLLSHLESSDRLDRTLLVFTADHGEEFMDHGSVGHGHNLYEEVLRVPLLVRRPAVPGAGRVAEPVSLVNLANAALTWLGLEAGGDEALTAGAPVVASLCVDGAHQAALREGDRKLVVDLKRREARLFDLGRDPEELEPLDEAAETRRLQAALREALGPGGFRTRACDERAPALDDDLREALDALGYGS